ncbi:hypothetical protein MBLNU13_g09050t1 [Cladosporium sp. NU13]
MWKPRFRRVLWIPLRNLKLKERREVPGYNLGHLLSHEFFTEDPRSNDLVNALWRTLKETRSAKTLFILDGLDEVLSDLNGDMEKFLMVLLNQPNVILTSRPHVALPPSLDPMDLEVETIGFYPEQVAEYIHKSFIGVPIRENAIKSFLRDHQLMQDLVRIPIQLDALCYTWNDFNGQTLHQTMTACYEAIERNLWKKDGVKLGKFMPNQFVRMREIEYHMKDAMDFLEALAFTGMYNDTVDFAHHHQITFSTVLSTSTSLQDTSSEDGIEKRA